MKEILIILMFLVPVFASAQEYSNLTSKDSLNINMDSSQVVVDSIVEANLKKEQITAIGGIPFGISREKALPVLRNKYGTEDYLSDNKDIVFKNIKYAGVDFNSVHFLFQSDVRFQAVSSAHSLMPYALSYKNVSPVFQNGHTSFPACLPQ